MADRVALVTGGSRGLGRAIAVQLARDGYHVAVNYQGNEAAAEEAAELCRAQGVRAECFKADVADYEQARQLTAVTRERMGGLYAVVASAGITPGFQYVSDIEPEQWRDVMNVNINGVFNTFHAAAQHLIQQGEGRMVALSSLATRYKNPGFGPYAASKAAVETMVAAMGKELAQYGVLVNAVAPGLFDTDMGRGLINRIGEAAVKASIPVQRLGRPEEVGDLVAFLCSEKAGFITGETYFISGGGRGVQLTV